MFPVVVRGGGDLATGTILHLSCAGYPVIVLESSLPTAIRREAAFSEAVYKNIKTIEGISCVKAGTAEEALSEAKPGRPVMLVDENASSLKTLKPEVLVVAEEDTLQLVLLVEDIPEEVEDTFRLNLKLFVV